MFLQAKPSKTLRIFQSLFSMFNQFSPNGKRIWVGSITITLVHSQNNTAFFLAKKKIYIYIFYSFYHNIFWFYRLQFKAVESLSFCNPFSQRTFSKFYCNSYWLQSFYIITWRYSQSWSKYSNNTLK